MMQGHELKALRKAMDMRQGTLANALGLTPQFIGMMERGERPVESRTAMAILYLIDHPEARPDDGDDNIRSYSLSDLIQLYLDQPGLHDGRTWGRWRFCADTVSLDLDSTEIVAERDDEGRDIMARTERYSVPLDEMIDARAVVNWIGQVAGKNWGVATLGHFVDALEDIFHLQSTFVHKRGYASTDAVEAELRARLKENADG